MDGGLGLSFVGEKVSVNGRMVAATKMLGEGGFSYVYLVKEIPVGARDTDGSVFSIQSKDDSKDGDNSMVLKVTSINSRQQHEIAEKEAKLLSRLSHPSIITMFDACYRTRGSSDTTNSNSGQQQRTATSSLVSGLFGGTSSNSENATEKDNNSQDTSNNGNSSVNQTTKILRVKERPQHMMLMEYCDGGDSLDVCNNLKRTKQRFDLPSLIIAFGQICNAVSYLHAQRPPIVHRDLKPVNFLVKNGAYKLCDFGSAIVGHVELKTSQQRAEQEDIIQRTTTQMFRAPEMVDLYMKPKLTQSTDVWALGCCLFSLAYLENCFEEGSNLAILSRKYKIPDHNPYGEGLVELIDRMLTSDCKYRSDMTEVILCLSAIYSNRPLPPRKKQPTQQESSVAASETQPRKAKKSQTATMKENSIKSNKHEGQHGVGSYRAGEQGNLSSKSLAKDSEQKKPTGAKKLNPNSAAARRLRAAAPTSSNGSSAPNAIRKPIKQDLVSFGSSKGPSSSAPIQEKSTDINHAFSTDFGGWPSPTNVENNAADTQGFSNNIDTNFDTKTNDNNSVTELTSRMDDMGFPISPSKYYDGQ